MAISLNLFKETKSLALKENKQEDVSQLVKKSENEQETAKEKYRKFCKIEGSIPLYSKDWWLDAVCGKDNWDVLVLESNGKISAAWPVFIKRKYGFKISTCPPFTQFMGVWVKYYPDLTLKNRNSLQMDVLEQLITQLPTTSHFQQSFDYSFYNWLPFYWKGYKQKTFYSFIIESISHSEHVEANLLAELKAKISAAQQSIQIKYDLPADQFYNFYKQSLKKQGKRDSFPFSLFNEVYNAIYEHNAGRVLYAVDEHNTIQCALFIIWDGSCSYCLINACDHNYFTSNSNSYAFLEAIKLASNYTNKFDFGGGMTKEAAENMLLFGAKPTPYSIITKTSSRVLKLAVHIKSELKNINSYGI